MKLKQIKYSPTMIHVIIVVAVIIIFILSIIGTVDHQGESQQITLYEQLVPDCYILTTTGKECPSCGMTRGFYAVFDGHITLAISQNVMSIPVVITLLVALVNSVYYIIKKRYDKWLVRSLIVGGFIIAVGFVVRYLVFFIRLL